MSSLTPMKRRKLNDATSRLSKPFVSPLRTSKSNCTPPWETRNNANSAPARYTPSTLAHTIKPAYLATGGHHAVRQLTTCDAPAVRSISARRAASAQWSARRNLDSEELAAQRTVTSLELQIKKVQNEVDALQQARSIAKSSTDADLEDLSGKWKLATQAVAEELFGSVKERICRMGGVASWREMEERKYDRSHSLGEFAQQDKPENDDADCEFDSEGEELPEDEQVYRKTMKRKALEEMAEAADVPEPPEPAPEADKTTQVWAEGGKDDDTFTMDMMLRSLNIDLNVIGYDKESQRWVT